jgi:hypothetical protein
MLKFSKLKIILCCLLLFSCNMQALSARVTLGFILLNAAFIGSIMQDSSCNPLLLRGGIRSLTLLFGVQILMMDIYLSRRFVWRERVKHGM